MTYLRLFEAAKVWPSPDGARVHPRKVRRAIEEGKPSRRCPGENIRLRALHNGAMWLTTLAWIEAYLEEISADRGAKRIGQDRRARLQVAANRQTVEHW
jgi:hypothetical protein